MVDNKKIAMRPAVELSYLPKEEQEILYDTMEVPVKRLADAERGKC